MADTISLTGERVDFLIKKRNSRYYLVDISTCWGNIGPLLRIIRYFMLIRFKVANFRSFGHEAEFSTIATSERSHRERVFTRAPAGLRLLPVAAFYGANASGKSNLHRAVHFARSLVVKGSKPEGSIPVEPFRLETGRKPAPSRFHFEILVDNQILLYEFAVTSNQIAAESLTEIRRNTERVIFSRNHENSEHPRWNLNYFKKLGLKSEELQFIEFVAKGTPTNQLFLREAHIRNVRYFEKLWKWFRYSLVLINPHSVAVGLESRLRQQSLTDFSTQILRSADVGIDSLGTQDASWDSVDLPADLKEKLENDLKDGENMLVQSHRGHRFSLQKENGKVRVTKLVSYHRKGDGTQPVPFDIGEESEGTQRIVDLLPAFYDLANATDEFVVFLDEIDRTLHSRLIRGLVEGYLNCRQSNARTQLLFTTHDVTLLDPDLFRRDEIWLLDKNEHGETEISSLADFKLRSDKRWMKDYLLGRFGGVPNIHRLPLRRAAEKLTKGD